MEQRKNKTNKQVLVAMVTEVEGTRRSSNARGTAEIKPEPEIISTTTTTTLRFQISQQTEIILKNYAITRILYLSRTRTPCETQKFRRKHQTAMMIIGPIITTI